MDDLASLVTHAQAGDTTAYGMNFWPWLPKKRMS